MLTSLDIRRFVRQQREHPAVLQRYLQAPRPDTRLPWRALPYTVLDVETTGLNPRRDAILSIGVVEIEEGRIRMDRSWYSLLRPPEHVVASRESIQIHGLMRQDVAQALPAEEVLGELLERLIGRVLVVHFASVDVDFLNEALRAYWGARLRGPAIDTVRLAHVLHQRARWTDGHDGTQVSNKLTALAERANLPVHGEHNALGDALTTAQLFLAQAARMERQGNRSLRSLLRMGQCLR
jgi:DNA polymerase-3 subunit epsilon